MTVDKNEENIEQDTEVLDFTKPDFTFIPKGFHEWKQQGAYLICRSCELEHGVYIGVNHWLVGFDGNNPIVKKVVITK